MHPTPKQQQSRSHSPDTLPSTRFRLSGSASSMGAEPTFPDSTKYVSSTLATLSEDLPRSYLILEIDEQNTKVYQESLITRVFDYCGFKLSKEMPIEKFIPGVYTYAIVEKEGSKEIRVTKERGAWGSHQNLARIPSEKVIEAGKMFIRINPDGRPKVAAISNGSGTFCNCQQENIKDRISAASYHGQKMSFFVGAQIIFYDQLKNQPNSPNKDFKALENWTEGENLKLKERTIYLYANRPVQEPVKKPNTQPSFLSRLCCFSSIKEEEKNRELRVEPSPTGTNASTIF